MPQSKKTAGWALKIKKPASKPTLILAALLTVVPLAYLLAGADAGSNLSAKRRHYYVKAATKYWGDRGELDKVDCRPFETHIDFVHDGANGRTAWTSLWGAYKDGHLGSDGYWYDGKPYCTIYFNLDRPRDKHTSCIIFMHEYGHMLGKDHNNNIQSPLYTGYVHDGTINAQLMNRWKGIILAKTLC